METAEKTRVIEATCPECRGPLTEIRSGQLTEYRCLVGHRYSAASVLQAHCEAEEKALWAAVVALEEAASLVESLAKFLDPALVERLRRQADEKKRQGAAVRDLIRRLEPFRLG